MLYQRLASLCIVVFTSAVYATGQIQPFSEEYRWVHFTTESGLPSDVVQQIYETDDSTLWVSTPAGLARFDGFQWKSVGRQNYFITGKFRDGLLAKGSDSLCFISDSGKILSLLDSVQTGFPLSNDSIVVRRGEGIGRLVFDKSGAIKVLGMESPVNVSKLFQSRSGTLWVETDRSLYRLVHGQWKSILKSPYGELILGGGPIGLNSVEDNISGAGLLFITRPLEMQGIWEWYNHGSPGRAATEKAGILKAMDIGPENQAVAVYRPDLIRYRSNGTWRTITLERFGINDIQCVRFLTDGDLLIGTRHGLYRYSSARPRWQSFQHPPPDLRNSVNEMLRARDGTLYTATSDGLEIHLPNGEHKYINQIDTTHLYALTGLGEDSEGNIWISSGSAFSGAFRWDKRRWKHFAIGDDPKSVAIHKIRKDRDGNLWFLGVGIVPLLYPKGQPGAFVLENGAFTRWGEHEGLLHGRVYAFAEGKDGSLWFGTINGLSRWKPSSSRAKDLAEKIHQPRSTVSFGRAAGGGSIREVPGDGTWSYWTPENGLRSNRVFALTVDSSNRLWFSGWGGSGNIGYVSENDSLRYISPPLELIRSYVYDLSTDSSGIVWIATDAGLYSYSNEVFIKYDTKSGLPHNELFPLLPIGNNIFVGTQGKGWAVLDNTIPLSPPPRIVIGPPVIEEQDAHLLWKAYAFCGELVPSEIPTRYRLNNGSWSEWEKGSSIGLKNLKPGAYAIQVQAEGLFGQYDTTGARASFAVLPPLYLRPVALYPGLVALLGIIGLTGTILWRKRKYDISIRASEERYRMITELMSDYAYLGSIDEDGTMSIAWLTESITRVTGYTIEEAKSPGFFERIVYHEDLPDAAENMKQLLGGQAREVEGRIVTKEGAVLWMRNYAIPIFDKSANRVTHVYGIARDITQRKHDEEQLRRLATELSRTEEQERRRMANFLHDSISQSLLISKKKLEALRESKGFSAAFGKSISEVSTILQQSIDNSRTLTFDLCPPILYDLGLAPAVDWMAEQMQEAHDLNVKFIDDGKVKRIGNELRNMMYAGAREALMNIVKHAGAKNVWIDVSSTGGEVVLAVEDDGAGFDTGEVGRGDHRNGGGFGLANLRERMSYLGGRFEIESTPGKGTRVTLAAPVDASSEQLPNTSR